MLDESVGYAQACDTFGVAVVCQPFQYGRTESAIQCTVLHGDDVVVLLCDLRHDVRVQWLKEAHVKVCRQGSVLSVARDFGYCLLYGVSYGAEAQYGCVRLGIGRCFCLADQATLAYFHGFQRTTPLWHYAVASRIPYYKWTVLTFYGSVHEAP